MAQIPGLFSESLEGRLKFLLEMGFGVEASLQRIMEEAAAFASSKLGRPIISGSVGISSYEDIRESATVRVGRVDVGLDGYLEIVDRLASTVSGSLLPANIREEATTVMLGALSKIAQLIQD